MCARRAVVAVVAAFVLPVGVGGCSAAGEGGPAAAGRPRVQAGASAGRAGASFELGRDFIGARWSVRSVTGDGRTIAAPPANTAWIEFGRDGLVRGSDGCHPLLRRGGLEGGALTVAPGPAKSDDEGCGVPGTEFRLRFREAFTGRLTVRLADPALAPVVTVDNEEGDRITVRFHRSEHMFDQQYTLVRKDNGVGDEFLDYEHNRDTWFRFGADGRVTGKLGCDDFVADAVFEGSRVAIGRPALTTHRTCPGRDARVQKELLTTFPGTYKWEAHYFLNPTRGGGDRGGLQLAQDVPHNLSEIYYTFSSRT